MKHSLLLVATLALTSGAAIAQCPSGQTEVVVAISTDQYGSETSWTLTGPGGSPSYASATAGTYTDHGSAGSYAQTPVSTCIPIGSDVVFTIHDAYGDGMCCAYGEGSYSVTMNGCQMMASGGAFATMEATTFTTSGPVDLDLTVNSLNIAPVILPGSVPITGQLQNIGTSTVITSYDLNYSIDGGTTVTQSMSNTIAVCATYAYTFTTAWDAAPGNHDVMVWVSNVNGGSDDNTTNDNLTHTISVASQTVPRVATIEEFGSSTCVPCANFNVTFAPLLASFNTNEPGSNVATVEYHMNWPSPGNDPSYNPDGNSRRGFYGVNAIPAPFIDGHGMNGNANDINSALAVPSFTDLQVSYVRTTGTDITVTANVTPYYNLDANIRVYIAVLEDYHYPASTTTQDDFEFAMRKMLPNAGGNALQPLVDGQVQTVTQTTTLVEGSPAQGNYHLWGSVAGITVVAFVQNADTKEILQGAISESHVGINEIAGGNLLDIYPNPTTGLVNLTYGKASATTAHLQVFNVLGEQVMGMDRKFSTSNQLQTIDLSSLENGVYYMSIAVDGQRTTRRIVVSK